MAKHNDLGKKGEQIAVEYLRENTYKILGTNMFVSHEEIDIIAEKDGFLVIVEVKTRSKNTGGINEVVSNKKRKHLISAVNKYIDDKNIDKEVRFDIIYIKNGEIEHVIDAFNGFDFV